MTEPSDGLKLLVDVLDRLGIPYLIGGSLASSVHGIARATADVDLIAEIRPADVKPLADALAQHFYADAEMMREAIEIGRPFNLIHYETSFKFDVFPRRSDAFSQLQFERRQLKLAGLGGGTPVKCAVATAEDIILNKLAWFRLGGEVSEQQWNDVRGVIEVRREQLDLPYLRQWAQYLKVDDLLEQVLAQRHKSRD